MWFTENVPFSSEPVHSGALMYGHDIQNTAEHKLCFFKETLFLWARKFYTTLVLALGGTTNETQPDRLNVADVLAELQSLLPRISLPLSLKSEGLGTWVTQNHLAFCSTWKSTKNMMGQENKLICTQLHFCVFSIYYYYF